MIHGLEGPGAAPYLSVQRLRLRVSILGFLSPRIILSDLEAYRPGFHLIVYRDGSTNQPQPRRPRKPRKTVLDTLFDLKAGHVSVQQGELDFENQSDEIDYQERRLPVDLDAADVSVRVTYSEQDRGNPAAYHIETGASHLNLFRGDAKTVAQTAQGHIEATVDLTRDALTLRSIRLSANGHDLTVSGVLRDFAHPHWNFKAGGELDLKLVDPITGFPNCREGLAHLDLFGTGEGGQFRVDGTLHVDRGSYVGPGVNATGFNLDARVHADPTELLVDSIVLRLRQGGQIEGVVALTRWLESIPGAPVFEAAPAAGSRKTAVRPIASRHNSDETTIPVNGKVTAKFENISVDAVLDMVGSPPFQRLGFDTRLNGPASAAWINGDDHTLAVSASFQMSAPAQTLPGEVASSGGLDATYTHKDGAVDLRQLDIRTPSSRLQVQGHLGAYPTSTRSALDVDFQSRNLSDFDLALRDLRLSRKGRQGVSGATRVSCRELRFHGTWTGSLADPHLAGNAQATQLAIELPTNPKDKSDNPESVPLDSVDATGSYSAARIDISRGQLRRGQGMVNFSGFLASSPDVPPEDLPQFNENSLLQLHLRAAGVAIGNVFPLTGMNLPITGQLNSQFDGAGPVRNLQAPAGSR